MSATHDKIDWSQVPTETLDPSVQRQIVNGTNTTLVRYTYAPGSVFPRHDHPHEQLTRIESGTLEIEVDGEVVRLEPGDLLRIAPSVPHGATVIGDEAVVSLNIFAPARDLHPSVMRPD